MFFNKIIKKVLNIFFEKAWQFSLIKIIIISIRFKKDIKKNKLDYKSLLSITLIVNVVAGSLSGYNNKYDTITNGVIRYNKYSDLVNAGKI